jgi:heme exporter protein A
MSALPLANAPALHLSARALACRRGPRLLFGALDFELRAGDLIWVRGRNGSGKTSLLRLAAGLATPESGELQRHAGRPLFVGHANALKEELTVAQALAFLLQLRGLAADRGAVQAALDRFGMAARRDAPVRSLSQGQRRRVALARLAAEREPAPWLLDEPFDALDAEGAERLNGLLLQHRARGGSVLLTGHQGLDTRRLQPRELDLDRLH